MEVFESVMATRATSGPLEVDWEVVVSGSDVDDLANAIDRTGLEWDVLGTSDFEGGDDFSGLLDTWNTSSHAGPRWGYIRRRVLAREGTGSRINLD